MRQESTRVTPHRHEIRVYYEDTDFSGLVYHASYLRFMERARTELLREMGLSQRDLLVGRDDKGFFFVVRAMNIDFRQPAHMDDLLHVETRLLEIGGASVTMSQEVRRDGALLVAAKVVIALVEGGRAKRMPPQIRVKFEERQHV
jgi:acyl-CoA thioester hydrolase